MKPQNSAADVLQGVQSAPSRIDGFPVNCPRTGKLRAERGSLRTASRTKQSDTDLGLRRRARRAAGRCADSGSFSGDLLGVHGLA